MIPKLSGGVVVHQSQCEDADGRTESSNGTGTETEATPPLRAATEGTVWVVRNAMEAGAATPRRLPAIMADGPVVHGRVSQQQPEAPVVSDPPAAHHRSPAAMAAGGGTPSRLHTEPASMLVTAATAGMAEMVVLPGKAAGKVMAPEDRRTSLTE